MTNTQMQPAQTEQPQVEAATKPKWYRHRWILPLAAFVSGLYSKKRPPVVVIVLSALLVGALVAVGVLAGQLSDANARAEQTAMDLASVEQQLGATADQNRTNASRANAAEDRAREAEEAFEARSAEFDQRSAELDQREADVAAREQKVTATEQRIAATSIGTGIWTVGVDVEPGTYRVAQALTGRCYWAILRTGSNGSDIIDNDGPSGGFPTVTLRAGQDFENSRCGTFVKQ
jgi:hypothetical protein